MKSTLLDSYRLFHNGALALARAELQGMHIDTNYCIRKKEQLAKESNAWKMSLRQENSISTGHILSGKDEHRLKFSTVTFIVQGAQDRSCQNDWKREGATDEEALSQMMFRK